MGKTNIEWCDDVWNPVRGCSRVSPGCVNCYAEKVAARFCGPGLAYEGLAFRKLKVLQDGSEYLASRWTGDVRLVPEHLGDPLRWTRPRRIFVNSMSDLFHEGLPRHHIAACFGIMALASHHTYQILTKRSARMQEILSTLTLDECWAALPDGIGPITGGKSKRIAEQMRANGIDPNDPALERFPLPWIHLGVSAEDQQRADERIPDLLATPAARRFVSYEPALGPVDFMDWLGPAVRWRMMGRSGESSLPGLDWIIVGGESGVGARAFDVAWARSTVEQCARAGVACFVKQLGANVRGAGDERPSGNGDWPAPAFIDGGKPKWRMCLRDRKGGDMAEWPADLRVREFPR